MRVFIAEKHSLAQAIAQHLPGDKLRGNGFIQAGSSIVTWAVGHVLELAPPEHYNPAWKNWNAAAAALPFPIERFALLPKKESAAQFDIISSLIAQASECVNAGDPGREGQMLIDEILEQCAWDGPTLRLQVNATDPASMKKALASMRPNTEFNNLYQAAKCRAQADWIVGMNLTVAATKALWMDGGLRSHALHVVATLTGVVFDVIPGRRSYNRCEAVFSNGNG